MNGAMLVLTNTPTPPEGRLAALCWKDRGCEMKLYPGNDTTSAVVNHVSHSRSMSA